MTTFSPSSSTSTEIACGSSSRVSASAFSRISSATSSSGERSLRCSGGKYAGPSGSSSTSSSRSASIPSPVFALTGWSAWKSPSFDAVSICVAMCPPFSRSTLFSAITTGTPSEKTRCGDEAVAGADPVARGEDEEDGVDVLERAVDGALHALRHRVERPLEPGKVDEDELVAVAVDDARRSAGASSAACRR